MLAARAREAPLRRRDAPGRDRRGGRALRARPQRRAARRRSRPRPAARRGLGRAGRADRPRARADELRADRRRRRSGSANGRRSTCSRERGVGLSRTMRPGVLRAVTHLDLSDDDIERALELVPAGARSACPASERRSTGCSPSGRPTGCRASRPRSCARASSCGRARSAAADYDDEREATPDTQYRIGSITKTFTATAIMQLRAEGQLDLDDRLEQHLDGVANGSPTIRRLLCHLSGLQREAGEMFVTGESPTEDELVDSMARSSSCSRPAQQHHYSNLAFALLGQVVARKSGQPYTDYVDERIIGPLGLERTTWEPQRAEGAGLPRRRVRAHRLAGARDRPRRHRRRPGSSGRRSRISAAGRRSSRAATTACSPPTRRGDVVPAGHVLPGRLGARLGARADALQPATARSTAATAARWRGTSPASSSTARRRSGAAALTNSGTRGDMDLFAISLAAKAAELWPPAIEPWRPEQEPPADVRAAARPLVVGGERVRLLVAGRRAAGEGRRRAARPRRDDVRARR